VSIQQAEEIEGEEAPVPSARAAELAQLSPSRAALELAWPGIIEQSVSALGTAGNFLFLMFPVWRSLAIGTIAVVSRRIGQGRAAEAADATRQSLSLGAIAGVLFAAFFVLFLAPLVRVLGADEEIVAIGAPFLAVVGAATAP
jgi:Na+-driven multidrug efflux pump